MAEEKPAQAPEVAQPTEAAADSATAATAASAKAEKTATEKGAASATDAKPTESESAPAAESAEKKEEAKQDEEEEGPNCCEKAESGGGTRKRPLSRLPPLARTMSSPRGLKNFWRRVVRSTLPPWHKTKTNDIQDSRNE